MIQARQSTFLFVCLVTALGAPAKAQPPKANQQKTLALGVDYADQVGAGYKRGYLYDEPKIRNLIALARRNGFDEIYWRISAIGRVTYRSKIMTVMSGDHLTNAAFAPMGIILRECDPLAVAVNEAHRQGLRLFVYITLFDFSYPGLESEFFSAHPEYWSRLAGVVADNVKEEIPGAKELAEFSTTIDTGGYSKLLTKGQTDHTAPYIPGVPSYGYQGVRAYLLAQLKELIAYKPDGVYFDVSRSHSGIYPVLAYGWYPQWSSPYLKYGYNEPEVALYKRLYRKNPPVRGITSLQSMDETDEEAKWNQVRGHFLTQFIREASTLVHAAGMKVAVGYYPSTYNLFQPGTHIMQQLGRMEIDWKTWTDEKLIDIIRLNVDHRKEGYEDWIDNSAEIYAYSQKRGVHVYVDCAISGSFDKLKNPQAPLPILESAQPELYYQIIADTTRKILSSTADGVFYYEADSNNERLYETIRNAARR